MPAGAGRPGPGGARGSTVRGRPAALPLLLALALLGVVLLSAMLGPIGDRAATVGRAPGGAPPRPVLSQGVVSATLVNGTTASTTSPEFWSLVVQTTCASCISTNSAVGGFLNKTPFVWFRYSQQSDQCNISANKLYSDSGSVMGGCGYSISSYKQWCSSRGSACHTILDLPAENNNSAEDASIANYIVHTAGFQPDYWSIGNEPTGWKHYGIPWTQWKSTDNSVPTPLAYAFDVKAVIAAVSAVDTGAKFIGIQAACECNTAWFQAVAKVDGSAISAIAYHTYPSTALSQSVTLQQFYDPLASSSNITTSFPKVRSAISGYCSQCGTLPILVDEYNAGPGWGPSNYAGSYANAAFLAASTVQALRANVTQLTIFDLQTYSTTSYGFSMMNANYAVGPTGTVYSSLLSHLASGRVLGTNVRTTVPSVWSVVSKNSTTESLLVVNANLTQSISLGVGSAFPTAVLGATYQWAPGQSGPNASRGSLPATYAIPPQGILLLDAPLPSPSTTSPLSARASSSATSGSSPLAVSFNGTASGGLGPYRFAWSFGDGGSSTLQSPSHTYTSVGNYTATLSVTDAAKNSSSSSVALRVSNSSGPLSVSVSATPSSGSAPLFVQFHASPSGGSSPYSYSWKFAVGGTHSSTLQSPNDTYLYTGNYTATVTLTDSAGSQAQRSVNVTVASPLALVASVGPAPGSTPLCPPFSAKLTGGVAPFAVRWTFGDGATGTGLSPTHCYAVAGSYLVSARATDAWGQNASASTSVTVAPPFTAQVSFSKDPVYPGSHVTVSAAVTGGSAPYTFAWSINGQPYAATSASFRYVPTHTSLIGFTVVVTDSHGSRASGSASLSVVADLRVGLYELGSAVAEIPSEIASLSGVPLLAMLLPALGGALLTGAVALRRARVRRGGR